MKRLILLVCVAVTVTVARIYGRCEWARILKSNGMDGHSGVSLADWVCMSRWVSTYNTRAINLNSDGSTDYGIFGLNSALWCDDGQTNASVNGCNILCSDVLNNNVSLAIECAKRIVENPSGISAWVAWRHHCEGQNLSSYLLGCGV